ncbi:MAG: EAL domain-containing protein, partial [Gammaproteobacteria bacterium]|nr:EAL domain-containing protein [Gammaproteobacteria bacterium]
VTAIIQMGHSLQLKTVAEGVETEEQVGLLAGLGCDLIQGFVVSVPMEAGTTQNWLSVRARTL